MTTNQPIIQLEKINKSYELNQTAVPVLKDISLTINSGELVAIVGPSGSGKSTLMNIMGLLDKPNEGLYKLDNQNIAQLSEDKLAELRNRYLGFIFQQFNLLPRFTAWQNISLPLQYRALTNESIEVQVTAVLNKVHMMHYAEQKPSQLSGGQQQRIAIARALVGNPEILLADEPTGALDSVTGHQIMELFIKLHQEGKTVIIITHDDKIADQCSRKIVLADGCIVDEPTN